MRAGSVSFFLKSGKYPSVKMATSTSTSGSGLSDRGLPAVSTSRHCMRASLNCLVRSRCDDLWYWRSLRASVKARPARPKNWESAKASFI